jgi:AcrR family transcriptional regulator
MARDSGDTRRRIFDAATAEFATHGIAGARVDRIAAAAGANKRLIYAYYGNKRELFEEVVSGHLTYLLEHVPFDAADLPEHAGALFDHHMSQPELARLSAWHALDPTETGHRIAAIESLITSRTAAIRREQRAGRVSDAIPAGELLTMIGGIARAWVVPPPERDPPHGPSPQARRRRRAAVVEATRRLVAPG